MSEAPAFHRHSVEQNIFLTTSAGPNFPCNLICWQPFQLSRQYLVLYNPETRHISSSSSSIRTIWTVVHECKARRQDSAAATLESRPSPSYQQSEELSAFWFVSSQSSAAVPSTLPWRAHFLISSYSSHRSCPREKSRSW